MIKNKAIKDSGHLKRTAVGDKNEKKKKQDYKGFLCFKTGKCDNYSARLLQPTQKFGETCFACTVKFTIIFTIKKSALATVFPEVGYDVVPVQKKEYKLHHHHISHSPCYLKNMPLLYHPAGSTVLQISLHCHGNCELRYQSTIP